MPKLLGLSEGFRKLQNFWEQLSSSSSESANGRVPRGNSGGSSPCLLESGDRVATAVDTPPFRRAGGGVGVRGSVRDGIRRRIEAFEEMSHRGSESRRSSASDATKAEKAEIFLRSQEEKLHDRAKYQSVFDERVGLSFEREPKLEDMLAISEDEEEPQEQQEASAASESAKPQGPDGLTGRLTGSGPGRTLWRNMKEVEESGLLDKLSKEEVKLQEAQFEILSSEAAYYKSLTWLIDRFYKHKQLDHTSPQAIVKALDKHHLFSNLVDIYECSATFLKAMEDEWKNSPLTDWIPRVILNNLERLKVYKDYCRNFYYQTKILNKLKANPEFQALVQELERSPDSGMIGLQSHLEMPMKRMMSLQLLMDTVVRRMSDTSPQYQVAIRVLGELLTLARECNHESNMMWEKEQLFKLQSQLNFAKVKKVGCWGSGRHLIREGQVRVLSAQPNTQGFVTKITLKKCYLQLHAFSDLLIVSKSKGDTDYLVLKHCPRSFVDAELVSAAGASSSPQRPQLRLRLLDDSDGTSEVTLLLEPRSREEADRWLAIFKPRDELGDPIYDEDDCPQVRVVRTYRSQQKDDLDLREGEIVNVFKKNEDGWFLGSRLADPSVRGWFPSSHAVEIENDHFKAKIRKVSFRRRRAAAARLRHS